MWVFLPAGLRTCTATACAHHRFCTFQSFPFPAVSLLFSDAAAESFVAVVVAAVADAVVVAAVGAVPTVAVSLALFVVEQVPMLQLLLSGSDRDFYPFRV